MNAAASKTTSRMQTGTWRLLSQQVTRWEQAAHTEDMEGAKAWQSDNTSQGYMLP